MIQIGTEGGFLPAPVYWPNTPVGQGTDPKSITVGNVKEHNLFRGPAERANVIIDFSACAVGDTFILYNDAPAAVPANDMRLDYYTGHPDYTSTGGTVPTLPGYGPNTRTLLQIRVIAGPAVPAFDTAALDAEFASTATTPGVFARSQDPILVPQGGYNSAYNAVFPDDTRAYARIQSTSLTFTPMSAASPMTIIFTPKAIAEELEDLYGRMSAFLGVEVPFTNGMNQTTIFYGFIDPPTELINDNIQTSVPAPGDGTQIWKITHNGVDSHPVHFHLFDVQLINRVDWAGGVKPPEPNERGWKETVRMNPLEDCVVALRPVAPKQPFGLPDSFRPLDPTMPLGTTAPFKGVDPLGNPITVINAITNFGWEYVWHCHILSHEEMDMMRPVVFNVDRVLPVGTVLSLVQDPVTSVVSLDWIDPTTVDYTNPATWGNPANEIGFKIQRADVKNNKVGPYAQIGQTLANANTFTDTTALLNNLYSYIVVAYNAAGEWPSNAVQNGIAKGVPAPPTGLTATVQAGPQVLLTWTDNANDEGSYTVERSTDGVTFSTIATLTINSVSYLDTPAGGSTYTYQVKANNLAGSSVSNQVTVPIYVPAAPTNLAGVLQTGPQIALTWIDNANNEDSFMVQRSVNGGAFADFVSLVPNSVSYLDTAVLTGNTYAYQVQAVNLAGVSTSNQVTVAVFVPAAPSNLKASAVRSGNRANVTLVWSDKSNNETGFVIQRATNSTFTKNRSTLTAGVNVTSLQDRVQRNSTYYYRIQSVNLLGASAWVNANPFPIRTP
ncbi:MAG: hypothetical protein ACE15F_23615 [bacterium]